MTLLLVPARTLPTVSTANSPGVSSRDTIICSRITIIAASTTGSMAACGMDPCAPRPNTVMRMLSAADRNGPGWVPSRPAGKASTCWASATSGVATRSASPSSTMRRAPSPSSSAGWNNATTVPDQCARPSASSCAAPRRQATWTSCPQACMTGTSDPVGVGRHDLAGVGQPGGFAHRQRVHVRAQQHARTLAVDQDADYTRPADAVVHVVAELAQPLRHEAGGALLLVGQLRVAVQIAVEVLLPTANRVQPGQHLTRRHDCSSPPSSGRGS